MANETWKFVQAKSKQAMKQVLGIRDEKARMKVTPPLAVAPVTQENDMRWNPSRGGAYSCNARLRAREPPFLALTDGAVLGAHTRYRLLSRASSLQEVPVAKVART